MTTTYAPEGMLSAAILEQNQEWQDAQGNVRRLEDLDRSHLASLEPFLLRHATALRWKWVQRQILSFCVTAPTVIGIDENDCDVLGAERPLFSDNGGNIDYEFSRWTDHEMGRPADEWLADRPLVKRIRELLAEVPT